MRKSFYLFLFSLFVFQSAADACDSCSCSLSRAGSDPLYISDRAYFDFTFEGVDWEARDARDAHELHHDGHHVHNKTHEEFYHFGLGFNPTDDWTLFAELPYVARTSTEIHSHATLGKKEVSEGLGDAKLSAIWRFWRDHQSFLGVLGGVKLPTGSTEELDSRGVLFEPELQPGSGSTDAFTGAVFQAVRGRWTFHGNVVYTFKTEGDHDFEYGDLFSSYVSLDYAVNPEAPGGNVTLGADMNWQTEGRQDHDGEELADSGGDTLLLGPSIKIEVSEHVALLANVLFPVYQDLGGVHQELDFVWNASAKISW